MADAKSSNFTSAFGAQPTDRLRASRPDWVRAPSKDAVKHRRSMLRISSAIAGWLLVKTRSGSLPGEGSLPIGTVTALNAKPAKAPLLLYRHRWYCAPTRREAEGGTYRLRAGEAGGHIDRGARASLRSHGGSLANCDSLRARAANRTRPCHANARSTRLSSGHRYALGLLPSPSKLASQRGSAACAGRRMSL